MLSFLSLGSTNVVVCTDPSGNWPHRQVNTDRVIASGSLDSVTVNTLMPVWQEVWIQTWKPKIYDVWLSNLPCLYVVASINLFTDEDHLKHLQFQGMSIVVCTDLTVKAPHTGSD